MRRRLLALLAAIVIPAAGAAGQRPQFQSSVEVLPVDVTVVDGEGRPVDTLSAADFTVRVDGRVRRVVSAEWSPRVTATTCATRDSNDRSSGGGCRPNPA